MQGWSRADRCAGFRQAHHFFWRDEPPVDYTQGTGQLRNQDETRLPSRGRHVRGRISHLRRETISSPCHHRYTWAPRQTHRRRAEEICDCGFAATDREAATTCLSSYRKFTGLQAATGWSTNVRNCRTHDLDYWSASAQAEISLSLRMWCRSASIVSTVTSAIAKEVKEAAAEKHLDVLVPIEDRK